MAGRHGQSQGSSGFDDQQRGGSDEESEGEGSEADSQDSSNTVEDFDSPTPEKKGRGDSKQRSNSSHQHQHGDRRHNHQNHSKVPPRHHTNNTFADFAEKNESQGVMLPRKSGRYEEADEQAEYYSAQQQYRYDRDGAKYAEQRGGDNREDSENEQGVSSVRSSGNWLLPSDNQKAGAKHQSAKPEPMRAPSPYIPSNKHSFVLVAHPRGLRTEHVQCTVRRDRTSIQGKLYPTYEMVLEDPQKTLIVACKMSLNRTSNYHLFDMTRGQAGSKLSKKNGNYLGKLRARNVHRTEYVLLNQSSEREEMAGVLFDRLSLLSQLKDGNQPRKMKVLVPRLDEHNIPVPNRTGDNDSGSLCEKLLVMEDWEAGQDTSTSSTVASSKLRANAEGMFSYQSKDPVFENGNYRLNFNGRVSMPSVKNYQLVASDDIDNIICQFGKVDEDAFHLDYKQPLNAVQAFAFALCQFNL